jgi:hypothetical protein
MERGLHRIPKQCLNLEEIVVKSCLKRFLSLDLGLI